MTKVAVATTSRLAADAARELAELGGNAVDCGLAAAILTMNTEPGVCALAGSAFVTVYLPGNPPVTIDGNTAVPGAGLPAAQRGQGVSSVTMDYGAGITTLVGSGSVAIPGSLAAIESAWHRFGRVDWSDLFAPTIRAVRDGFPLSKAAHYYLGYSGERVFSRSDDGFFALHDKQRALRDAGSLIRVPHLADSLAAIAAEGSRIFYHGDLAAKICQHVADGGGALTREDLSTYEAVERAALSVDVRSCSIASNPPPAIGGTTLAALLLACSDLRGPRWDRPALAKLIAAQHSVLGYRKRHLDLAEDVGVEATKLMAAVRGGNLPGRWSSAATVHTSAVDADGLACAITASSGYGSGEMAPGTGIWLNNCLGELELNRRGLDAGPPGRRLPSNMSPSVARRGDTVLAIGSPGADRITTALHQFLVNHMQFGLPLDEAIAHPRVHVDTSGDTDRLMAEPGLDLPPVDMPVNVTDGLSMYFGGVGAALFDLGSGFQVAADPRREGGTYLTSG